MKLLLGLASHAQMEALFVSFYSDLPQLPLVMERGAGGVTGGVTGGLTGVTGSLFGSSGSGSGRSSESSDVVMACAAPGKEAAVAAAAECEALRGATAAAQAAAEAARQGAVVPSPPGSLVAAEVNEGSAAGAPIVPRRLQQQQSCVSAAERQRMLAALRALASAFAAKLPDGGVSMAALQGHLMLHKKDPWGAVASASAVRQHKQDAWGGIASAAAAAARQSAHTEGDD